MNTKQGMDLLRKEFIFYSQWQNAFVLRDDYLLGQTSPNMEEVEKILSTAARYCKDMTDAGAKIHSFDVSTGWVGIDGFNSFDVDMVLKKFFDTCPDAYLIPRITNFNPTYTWQRAYPEEICIYEDGRNIDIDDIPDMINTVRQDRKTGGDIRIGYQSFASMKWRQDALAALERIIKYIEASPYADRIIGYHIGYGFCGETHFWGACGIDHCKRNKKAFYDFGIKKYGSVKELEKIWKVEDISPDTVPLPTMDSFSGETKNLDEFLHTSVLSYGDYYEYLSELSYSIAHDFAYTVKQLTDKIVGIFHGYVMGGNPQVHGHTDLKWILDDPNIDFICAPKFYYRAAYGEPCGSPGVLGSVNRKKLWVEELDNRTHLVKPFDYICGGSTKNLWESKWVMWRDFARLESSDSSYWWMDLGGGWYDDPELQAELKKVYEYKKKICDMKHESIAETLIVVDELAINHTVYHGFFNARMFTDTIYEVGLTGAPYDVYMYRDLWNIDLSGYKLVVFLNPFDITAEKISTLGFREGTRFLWNCIPGGNVDEAYAITGMRMKETGKHDLFPYVEILPTEDIKIIETYEKPPKKLGMGFFINQYNDERGGKEVFCLPKKGIRTATRGVHTICALPALPHDYIRAIGEEAGCKYYAPSGEIVYGDNRFIMAFNKDGWRFIKEV